MRVLVTGSNGQLGYDVINELENRGHIAIGADIDDMDITDAGAVDAKIKGENPDAVIHCAAWTAVDAAEDNVDKCRLVNKNGTENIAAVCEELDVPMMYISTDYVFDGEGTVPWEPDDERHPLNIYGLTKYEGELAVERLKRYFIVRISWVFGVNGNNFVKTVLKLGKTKKNLTFINDQFGSPTYTFDLAKLLVDMIESDKYGKYHASNEGICTWYDFTCEILKKAGLTDVKVSSVSTEEYPTAAKRPHNSRMNKNKLTENGFKRLPEWQDALERYLETIGEIKNGKN